MNNILEATLQIKDKNIIWDIKFKRRYLKRENLLTYLPYIQNTCEYPTRTNGPIEGINNKIKVLKRKCLWLLETITILETGLF